MASPVSPHPSLRPPVSDAFEALTAEARRRKAWARKRGKRTAALALLCAVGGAWAARRNADPAGLPPVTASDLAGTWELAMLGGHPVGPGGRTAVVSQRVTFRDGQVTGETRLRGDSEAAATQMPFPDQSVSDIDVSDLGGDVTARWQGRYEVTGRGRVAFTVGQARYSAFATHAARLHTLAFAHDPILTYRGKAVYRRR